MSIQVALHHRTHYQYDRWVTLGPQTVRLRPAPHARPRILSYSLRVQPDPHFINWQQDPQSNYLARLVFPEKTKEFLVEVDLVVEMAVFNAFDFFLAPEAETFPFRYDPALDHELEPFRLKGPLTPKFAAYLQRVRDEVLPSESGAEDVKIRNPKEDAPSLAGENLPKQTETPFRPSDFGFAAGSSLPTLATAPAHRRTIDFLVDVNRHLWRDLRYVIRLEPGVQTPEETLEKASGSCRDSAWLLCQLFRHCGLAARFVSGYLVQLAPDQKSLDGPSGPEKDFTDLHAWCEVYLPGAGWIGLDPTSGLLAGEGHIPLAVAPDPTSAAPITGVVDPCKTEFQVEMTVTRIHESPRVTKPYAEEQWRQIEALGHQLDVELVRRDCRLTMGGEPTFVSIDDMDGAEWNTAALGPMKPKLADELLRRLKGRFTHGAFLHYGMGKWYPGESLPRWAHAAYWRKDGQPVWQNEALLAEVSKDYGFDADHAEAFVMALTGRLGCGRQHILPAFEDTWYYLWKERRLPVNVDPFTSKLQNPEDRARLAKVFEQGLDQVVGYVLPLHKPAGAEALAWHSGPWPLRGARCYLIPGDSPIGLRLPMDSLPYVAPAEYPHLYERDPLEERPAQESSLEAARVPIPEESAAKIVRTALCVEPREGRLHVFMPPARTLEDYLELVAAVEDTAELLKTPVMIEGYTPPFDPRLNVLKITPDPGVLEVNIHPAGSWDEMVKHTEILYEEARQTRLGTEKFMLDGRHTGTGGGNHIVIGGPTPAESPVLRRPDLLRSLVSYWQNHPALSFLFSGMFIGPTSQSPRIDEARNDSLYELELAFRQVPDPGPCPPWLVDRLFRHLLIDTTGNTHRAEFCIDKLYSPDSSTGRLGLLEMRAFEMPPHARMSLVQQLLLRALIAKFWDKPYTQPLVRWGTDIHDRWMLPHFVWSDLEDVLEDLQLTGYPMKSEWFAPHFEFRFPQVGDLALKNLHLEIRQALEPWHVLGEEARPGGTVRYVDSSLERVQVKVRGLVDSRHVLAVGGVAIPLGPTGTNGEYVAGVRYRAWQPPNCLQPTIGVHAPLVFDVVDTWNGHSIGGCTYHVAHPGGLSYATFPINAYEAESRRLGRFFRLGHTPGPMQPRKLAPNPQFPFTLDLRQA